MKVFKFGGASVKDPDAVRNVGEVIRLFPNEKLVVVVSAMGKTTNAFELLLNAWYHNTSMVSECLQEIIDYHNSILRDLFPDFSHPVYVEFNQWQSEIEALVLESNSDFYDYDYDAIVGKGELISTKIIRYYLETLGLNVIWQDARKIIRTDHTYRDAKIDWDMTSKQVQSRVEDLHTTHDIIITQGFIGSTKEGIPTTLGREGSDYTAAIMAYGANAESVTIWKDVPGMLNADPKWFDNTEKLDQISYREAIELAYYGASVIHPKTIKPLENKKIPLFVKSFLKPQQEGTTIHDNQDWDSLIPSFIFKVNQVLISITSNDFSFIVEENLEHIFNLFHKHRVRIHLMQNSALNFSVCVNMDAQKVPPLLEELKEYYQIKYNENVELVTIRHYDEATIDRVTMDKKILVDQRTRNTARMVMRDVGL